MKREKQLELLRENNQELVNELERIKKEHEIDNLLHAEKFEQGKQLILELEVIKNKWENLISEVENIREEYEDLLEELKIMRKDMKKTSKEFRKQMRK